jgi:hypothetical protein
MVDYKTLRVPEPDYEEARESKNDSETWGEFLRRCSENPPENVELVPVDELERTLLGRIDDAATNLETKIERLQR